MKLLSLKLSAFGPFKTEQQLDFSCLEEADIFLISGDTGAGKTTIFDAVCFALYGETSGGRKNTRTLKSDFAPPSQQCFVELTFESNGRVYRIQRSPEQLKPKRGGDYTTVSHKAELLLPDGKAVTNLKQIKELIETEIIGLDCGNFSKIVMLPQGQFQKLLTEKSSDKTATFREIFGTEIFQKLTGKLFERTRTTEQQNQTLLAQNKRLLADILTDSPGLLQQQASDCPDFTKVARLLSEQNSADTNRLKELEGEAARISRLELSLQTACAEAEQLKQDFARREELQLQLDALHAEQPRIEQLTVLCQKLRQAEELLPLEESTLQLIERVEQLDEEHRKTLALRQTQTERLENLLPSYQALEQLRYKEDSLKEQIRELLRAEEQKAGIAAAQKQLDHLDQRIKQASREIEACEQRLALDLLQQQLGEFKQLDALQTESEQLAKSLSDAEKAYQRACTHFFEEQAWTMAENLQEGEKCPVCGSVHHPQKASPPTEGITQAKVQQYQAKRDRLVEQAARLKQKQSQLVNQLAPLDRTELTQRHAELTSRFEGGGLPSGDCSEQIRLLTVQREEDALACEQLKGQIAATRRGLCDSSPGLIERLNREQGALSAQIKQTERDYQNCRQELSSLEGRLSEQQSRAAQLRQDAAEAQERFDAALSQSGLDQEYPQLKHRVSERPPAEQEIAEHTARFQEAALLLQSLEQRLAGKELPDLESLCRQLDETSSKRVAIQKQKDALSQKLAVNRLQEQNLLHNRRKSEQLEQEYRMTKRLTDLARGGVKRISLEKFVLASYFDEIIAFANLRLCRMSGSRYRMSRITRADSDGLDIEVFDNYTGRMRHVSTLSGGETFLASLSLSLGLADVVSQHAGGIQLSTMLIDEGFGSLDSEALNLAIDCLTSLQNGGRLVGIISHVPELRERIQAKLIISKGNAGSTAQFFLQ